MNFSLAFAQTKTLSIKYRFLLLVFHKGSVCDKQVLKLGHMLPMTSLETIVEEHESEENEHEEEWTPSLPQNFKQGQPLPAYYNNDPGKAADQAGAALAHYCTEMPCDHVNLQLEDVEDFLVFYNEKEWSVEFRTDDGHVFSIAQESGIVKVTSFKIMSTGTEQTLRPSWKKRKISRCARGIRRHTHCAPSGHPAQPHLRRDDYDPCHRRNRRWRF